MVITIYLTVNVSICTCIYCIIFMCFWPSCFNDFPHSCVVSSVVSLKHSGTISVLPINVTCSRDFPLFHTEHLPSNKRSHLLSIIGFMCLIWPFLFLYLILSFLFLFLFFFYFPEIVEWVCSCGGTYALLEGNLKASWAMTNGDSWPNWIIWAKTAQLGYPLRCP